MNFISAEEMEALGRAAFGAPNERLSNRRKGELRFGNNGSKSVDLKLKVFFDFETSNGGGYRDLYKLVHHEYPSNGSGQAEFSASPRKPRQIGNPVAWWDYHDEHGSIVARTVRFEPDAGGKTFRQCRPTGEGWIWSVRGLQIPLYRLPALLRAPQDATIYITEGEKQADALHAWGLIATTNIGGARKFHPHHAKTLVGHHVVILPDNDEAGRAHAELVLRELHRVDVSCRIVELPGLPPKGDIIDWIAAGGTAEKLAELVGRADEPAPASECVDQSMLDGQAEIARLAKLPLLKYGQRRAMAAKALGIPVGLLDKAVSAERGDALADTQGEPLEFVDPEPWPQPVDGFRLVCDIRDLLHRHVVLPLGAGWAIALWCLHTYLLGITEHTPRLAIVSPERGCGKTTLLDLLGRLVFRPLLAANLTAAATFRVIARHRPSLLIDEADTFLHDNEELRGVLNAGHRHDGFVLRTVGEDMEPRRFRVFGAVAIALIGRLHDTLADRSIAVRMRRATVGEIIEPIRKQTHAAAAELVRKAYRWAEDHRDALTDAEPILPNGMWNRVADNWRPLFAIAEEIGDQMPGKLTEAAETLLAQGEADPESLGVMLLHDIREVFREDGCDRLPSKHLVEILVAMEERPWGAFGKGDKPLTPRRLADLLGKFGIVVRGVRDGRDRFKGYLREQFEDAWTRYLEPETGPI